MSFWNRFKKKNPPSPFAFQVEDRFALKGDAGVVVAGLLVQGRIRVGDSAACYSASEQLLFTCQIGAIEQPGIRIQAANADGINGVRYALMIRGYTKADFQQVAFLRHPDSTT